MIRKPLILLVALLLALSLSCAPTPLGKAKQISKTSYEAYELLKTQTVEGIDSIVRKHREEGTISRTGRERLSKLDDLREILEKYAQIHNLFNRAVLTWEETNKQPENLDFLEAEFLRLTNEAIDVALELGLKIPEGWR